jgi:GntR family transcriptional regulator
MTLHRASAQPLYHQVAHLLEQDIAEGRFPPYSRLMSESALMRRFEVSRVTVRAAIMRLVRKGLVDVRQGKGTFVAGPVIRHGLDRFRGLYDVLVAQGFTPDRRLLEYRHATRDECADTPFAASADVPMLLRRLYVLHGKPFAVVHALLAPQAARISRREAAALTIVEMLGGLDGGVAHASIAIRARPPGSDVRALLGLPLRRSVMLMERTSYAVSGAVLDFSQYHIVPEAWEFSVSVDGPARGAAAPRSPGSDGSPVALVA